MQLTLHSKLSRVYETVECLSVCIGVNATETLGGGSQVERRTRESRSRRRWGSGVWEGAVPLPRKFMNFSSQNGVISLIWCMVFRSSAEGKKIKHLSKYWESLTQDDPCKSNIGGSRLLQPLRRWRLCLFVCPSIPLSVCLIDRQHQHPGEFAAKRPAGRKYWWQVPALSSNYARRTRHGARNTALSSKCAQRHVDNRRGRRNTDLL